ncbi:hypothetical protein ACFO25_07555 [Paenactinomyces guangxiensis]|uniref:hypothetical protein n=1 Tax=Paenactinomyces guangxiensis TaxID=1490290 RepID=UPI002867CFB0|nr:hypothetical protein [Paenactinomyces guangxiensis]
MEIARFLSISKNRVYTSLHRSKRKLLQEHLRLHVRAYLNHRKGIGAMGKKVLDFPVGYNQAKTWTSIGAAMKGVLNVTEQKGISTFELMGYSSLAFRINIHPGDVDVAGPTAFIWDEVLTKALANLGFESRYVGTTEYQFEKFSGDRLTEAMEAIQTSIDRGKPAIVWDMFVPEFGLIYGYDDGKQQFEAVDFQARQMLPYMKLGQGQLKELAVLTVGNFKKTDPGKMLTSSLQMILDHAYGRERTIPGYVNGLAAYHAWIEAFRGGNVDPFGNAYNTAVVADARRFAAHFAFWLGNDCTGLLHPQEMILLKKAAVQYTRVAEVLTALTCLFPFPGGGEPNQSDQSQQAIKWLTKAKEAEEQGVQYLSQLLEQLLNRLAE